MKSILALIRIVILALLLSPALPLQAAEEDSPAFGHALSLIHLFVRIAAESDTPTQSLRAIDEVLLGRNAAANEALAGLAKEMLADLPPQHRATIAAIGRDLATAARKNLGVKDLQPGVSPLQARKDLTEMGLTYHDSKQFLSAAMASTSRRATSGGATQSISRVPTATSASPS